MLYILTKNGKFGRDPVSAHEMTAINRDRELYSSLFYFGEEMAVHLKEHGTPAGYNGPVYGHHFVVDLDGDEPFRVAKSMLRLLNDLWNLQIVSYLFRSGRKGFHLYIPKHYIEYPEELESKWNLACRAFALKLQEEYPELTEFIDESIYDKQRIFRFPYSVHQDTGKRKDLLAYEPVEDIYNVTDNQVRAAFTLSSSPVETIIQEIFCGYRPSKPLFKRYSVVTNMATANASSTSGIA